MRNSRLSRLHSLFFGIALFACAGSAAFAQQTSQQGVSAQTLISQLAAAFSGGQVVEQVQLYGDATWYAGSLEDSGTVSLTASTSGSSSVQLALTTTGQRTEIATGTRAGASCQWAGADGVAHEIKSGSCLRPVLWFLPALSLQPALAPSNLSAVDLGVGPVGTGTTSYRHLRSQLVIAAQPGQPSTIATLMTGLSTTDIGLDTVSLLPAVLAYSVHPDNGAPVSIAIEIHYSDYRTVSGVQIPFHIQRYVNGFLQLDILVSSAAVN